MAVVWGEVKGLAGPREPEPRPHLARLQPAQHGGPDYALLARLGLAPGQIIDFSVNANPYGPSPRVRQTVTRAAIEQYPDSGCRALAERLAARHGVAPEQVLVGNGSTELIRLLALAYLDAGDPCLILEPTFGEYRAAAGLAGARISALYAGPTSGFCPDLDACVRLAREVRPRLTYLCNPNNPTGTYLPRAAVEALAEACTGGLLAIDQAYLPFVADPWPTEPLLAAGNVVLLHSMTKAEALAGLRLGYLLGPERIVRLLRTVQGPWSVNALAQAAGLAALEDTAYLKETVAATVQHREALARHIAALGLPVLPTATHYFLVEVGDAAAWKQALLERRILVRDCASFGLPGYLRIAARRPEENALLVEALGQVATRLLPPRPPRPVATQAVKTEER